METVIFSDSLLSLIQNSECRISKWIHHPTAQRRALKIGNYFTFREKQGLISYCPAGKTQTYTPEGTWERKGRQDMKPGRLMKLIFPTFPDTDIELFTARFRAAELPLFGLEILSDEDEIYGAYADDSNFSSCMTGDEEVKSYGYSGHSLAVIRDDEGNIEGRAVLWNITLNGLKTKFLDRRYGTSTAQEKLKLYAVQNGYNYAGAKNRGDDGRIFTPEGNDFEGRMFTTLDVSEYGQPYLDTFSQEGCRAKIEIEGDHEGQVQTIDGDWIDEDDAVMIGDDWYESDDSRVSYCNISNEYVLTEDTYTIELGRGNYSGTITIHRDRVTDNS